ncbi:hypothetical protein OE88DRAFT_1736616 [Heliocybe sulcata]|uniref:C2H2-type domain-containing protein n=1 Tax=Heliocybe sulcata TaxID=5364 RepID=A0A5C3MXJ9_9AGAM|nr:hypothetical protein OE88DRAFT_1736616 [Heliocybe sulcata]
MEDAYPPPNAVCELPERAWQPRLEHHPPPGTPSPGLDCWSRRATMTSAEVIPPPAPIILPPTHRAPTAMTVTARAYNIEQDAQPDAWADPTDFALDAVPQPLHPISPTSTLSPISSAPHTPAPLDAFERDFCTNFTCCGLSLSDLHELVDHFEESHVLLVSPSPPSRPSSPRYHPYMKPHVVSYPNPSPYPHSEPQSQSHLSTLPLHAPRPTRPFLAITHSYPRPASPLLGHPNPEYHQDCGCGPDPCAILQHQYQDHASSWSWSPRSEYADLAPWMSPGQGEAGAMGMEEMALPPGAFTVPPAHPSFNDRPVGTGTGNGNGNGKSRSGTGKVERRRERAKRERGFRCPKLGCTKSYLNPNGLKYHLEKGTCVFGPVVG